MAEVLDGFFAVIPAQAGIHLLVQESGKMDPGLRRDDGGVPRR